MTTIKQLQAEINDINDVLNTMIKYMCVRDGLPQRYPHDYIKDWIIDNVNSKALFNGTMTDLLDRLNHHGIVVYKSPAPLGRALKVMESDLSEMGFVITEKDKKGRFQIYKV